MYCRYLDPSDQSFFLFGPRGTGKTTWLKNHFGSALTYDLLDFDTFRTLLRNPNQMYLEIARTSFEWVVIDEVQRVPVLLNEVHRGIESLGKKFVLTSSSARRLRKPGVNLLTGRALTKSMFALTSNELGDDFDVEQAIRYGTLPQVVSSNAPDEYLRSYAQTFLEKEIQAEAQIRNLDGFARFLEIAARQNAQVTSTSSIARDAAVARTTVQSYFKVLEDTLIAFWLQPWKLKRSNKQVVSSKFYLFDCGVTRALADRLPYPVHDEERGALFESLIVGEIRAYLAYTGLNFPMYFYRSYAGVEVDVIFESSNGYIAIEAKSSSYWERKFNRGLHKLARELGKEAVRKVGVFNGSRPQLVEEVHVLPIRQFLQELWAGNLFN